MDLSGSHYIYDNVMSREYGLIFANVSTERQTILNGTTKTVTMFNGKSKSNYFLDDNYSSSPVAFTAEIVTDDAHTLTVQEQRDISQWMFNKQGYGKLFIDPADDVWGETCGLINGEEKRFYYNCRFTNPSRIEGNGGTVGFKFTMECDSYMLRQEAVTQEFTVNVSDINHSATVTVNVDSDMNDYIYPKVTIQMGNSGGNIKLANNTDSNTRFTSFTGVSASVELNINGETNQITPSGNYSKFTDKNFLRLLPGDNTIIVYGNISTIAFEWENRRYS